MFATSPSRKVEVHMNFAPLWCRNEERGTQLSVKVSVLSPSHTFYATRIHTFYATLSQNPWPQMQNIHGTQSPLLIPPATAVSGLHSCSGFPSVSCWISSELNTQSGHDMLFFIRCLPSLSLIIFIAICSIILYTICTQELFYLEA